MAGALIGALRVSLSAETSAFEAGMKRSQRTAQSTANSITGSFKQAGGAINVLKSGVAGFIASLSVGTILAAGKAALDYAASLGETAEQLGVTTRELQNFRAAALQNGASVEEADAALGKLSLNMSKALSGSKQAAAAFSSVGVSISDMTTKSRWEVIGQIADQMIRQGGAAKNAAAGVAIFGRGFQKIIPTLDQGSAGINALADANERLGGVLSDKEIQNADKTADKIGQLNLVLKAKLASDIAANSNAIAEFTTFLFDLVNAATKARQALIDFQANYNLFNIGTGKAFGFGYAGKSVTTKLGEGGTADAEARRRGLKLMSDVPRATAGAPPKFLAGGGGGGRAKRDRSAEEAQRKLLDNLRDQQQFDQDILRAKQDILQSQRSLATNGDDRANIDLELLASERRQFESQMAYERKVFDITNGADGISEAQAEQKRQLYDINESLQRQAIEQEQQRETAEQLARLADIDYDGQREALELEASMAETASEQRDVQLRILDLYYRHERAELDAILAKEKIGSYAWEEARRRKAALDANQAGRVANVKAGTRGPLEDYMSKLPSTTEKWNEALENVAAQGLKSVEDGIVDVLTGAKSVGEALQDILGDIISQLIRIGVQKMIVMAVGKAGLGFASGGFVSGAGSKTSDSIPAMLSNGEFVLNAAAVGRVGLPVLQAINSGAVSMDQLCGCSGKKKKGGILGVLGMLGGFGGQGLLGMIGGGGLSGALGTGGGLFSTSGPPPIFGSIGKIFGFSEGGYVGRSLPIARTQFSERAAYLSDNSAMRGGDTINFSFPGVTNAREARQAGLQAANALHRAVGRSVKVNG